MQYLIRQLQIHPTAPRTLVLLHKHLIKWGIYPPPPMCLIPHYLNNGNLPAAEASVHLLYETLRCSQWRFEFLPWRAGERRVQEKKVPCQNTLNRWFRIFKKHGRTSRQSVPLLPRTMKVKHAKGCGAFKEYSCGVFAKINTSWCKGVIKMHWLYMEKSSLKLRGARRHSHAGICSSSCSQWTVSMFFEGQMLEVKWQISHNLWLFLFDPYKRWWEV